MCSRRITAADRLHTLSRPLQVHEGTWGKERTVGQDVPVLLVGTVTDVRLDHSATLELAAHAGVDTLLLPPVLLREPRAMSAHRRSGTPPACRRAMTPPFYLQGIASGAVLALGHGGDMNGLRAGSRRLAECGHGASLSAARHRCSQGRQMIVSDIIQRAWDQAARVAGWPSSSGTPCSAGRTTVQRQPDKPGNHLDSCLKVTKHAQLG